MDKGTRIGIWAGDKSAYIPAQVFFVERGIFMNIQMNFDADCLEYILKNNLLEKIRPYLSLGEVLEWMADHPEVLACKKDEHLYTGAEGVGVVLRLHREKDTFTVTVYDVSIY